MHIAEKLLSRGESVTGVDNLNSYYNPELKEARVSRLQKWPDFRMVRMDIADAPSLERLVRDVGAEKVIHLAAQAGVRHSFDFPFDYERSNLAGHLSVLEACRRAPDVEHLIYASSSSVYGNRMLLEDGFREDDPVDRPISLYAATKRACELMSTSYAVQYRFGQTGLRFFSVYGPWGRPDMAYFSFTRRILMEQPIEIYGQGRMARDFTYIDDVVNGVLGTLDRPAAGGEHRIFNVGDNRPVGLMDMIEILERALGRKAEKVFTAMQPGDVSVTCANIAKLNELTGYTPSIALEEGLLRFVSWYREFHGGQSR
jgi:UDP-glucuronate 4-epimerase